MRKRVIYIFLLTCLALSLTGCEAFRKKFVRKAKREKEIKVVVRTHEYESQYSVEEAYQNYYTFWSVYCDELIDLLNMQDASRKRRVYAAKKIIENLEQMRQLLCPEKQDNLSRYILEQKDILSKLDRYNLSYIQRMRISASLSKLNRQIEQEYNFKNIQECLAKK